MIDWGVAAKIALSILGFAFLAFGNSYQAHPDASPVAHAAAIAVAVGGYLVGLFQARPVAGFPAKPLVPLVLLALLLSGCATTAGQRVEAGLVRAIPAADLVRIDSALDRLQNHGLIQLAMRDAADTQAWVDAQAPTLGPIKTAQARMCPTMVALAGQNLADKIQALRDRIKAAQTAANASAGSTLQGPEAILFLTQLKFGATGDPQAQINGMLQDVGTRLDAVVQGCLALFPTKQINQVLNLAGQAGLAGYMPALAPFIAAAGGPLGPLTNLVGQ